MKQPEIKKRVIKKPVILSCRGSLTVQFLLGFILILTFVYLFAAMSLTLTMSEVTQYMTYMSGRSLFLSNGTVDFQKQLARKKYSVLQKQFKKYFNPKIFKIQETPSVGLNNKFKNSGSVPNLFYGVWTSFIPKILQVDTMWGSTNQGAEKLFTTTIGSYLGREPSKKECEEFLVQRYEVILQKHGIRIGNAGYVFTSTQDNSDNGC